MAPPPALERVSLAAHAITVFALGLMAGFFATYSANVNFATAELDGPTYALVQSSFNRNVRHALFYAVFFGPVPAGLIALASAWRARTASWWRVTLVLVLLYAAGIVFFTRFVNLPLNYLTESWTPTTVPADWTTVRDAWNRANLLRAVLATALFGGGLWSLRLRWTLR